MTRPAEALEKLYEAYTAKEGGETFAKLMRELLRENPDIWVLFEVYLDLRKRGRLPAPGPRPNSLLLRKSKKDPRFTRYILVLEESRLINIEQLYSFVEEARKNGWDPLLAIVDRYGDITYYSVAPFTPKPREEAASNGEDKA